MTSAARSPRPGHPPVDIAWRLRNWAWYWTVKRVSDLSDEALDARYLPESPNGSRKRFFQRLRGLGSDPTRPRADLDQRSVFHQVHGQGQGQPLEAAESDFRSALWDLLTKPGLRIEDHRRYINRAMTERGWYRLRTEDRRIAAAFLLDPLFGFPEGREHVYSAMLYHLETHPSADHIALLATLFREAMSEVALPEANQLRSSLMTCARNWIWSLHMPPPQRRLLRLLIEQRLVHDWWFTPDISLKELGSQRRYVQALVQAHLATPTSGITEACAVFPIVQRSPRLEWLEEHRSILESAADELFGPDAIGTSWRDDLHANRLSDMDPQVLRTFLDKVATDERAWHAYADEVQSMIEPPPQDMRYCLPVEPGSIERAPHRPPPFLSDGHIDIEDGRTAGLAPKPTWDLGDPTPPLGPQTGKKSQGSIGLRPRKKHK